MSLCVLWRGPAWQWSGWFVSCFRVNCLPSFVVWWPLAARPASGRAGFDSETLGFNFETLGFNFEMLGFKFEMLGFKFEMLGFNFEMLGFKFEMLGFKKCSVSNLKCSVSTQGFPIGRFARPQSEFYLASGLGNSRPPAKCPRTSNRSFCKTFRANLLSEWPSL